MTHTPEGRAGTGVICGPVRVVRASRHACHVRVPRPCSPLRHAHTPAVLMFGQSEGCLGGCSCPRKSSSKRATNGKRRRKRRRGQRQRRSKGERAAAVTADRGSIAQQCGIPNHLYSRSRHAHAHAH
eukprot:3857610-Prymnesium_polylepis.1